MGRVPPPRPACPVRVCAQLATASPGCIYPEKGGVGCQQSSLQLGKAGTRRVVWHRAPPSGVRGPPSEGQGRRQGASGAGLRYEPFPLL